MVERARMLHSTIVLQPSTIEQLKSLSDRNNSSYNAIILKLIYEYKKQQQQKQQHLDPEQQLEEEQEAQEQTSLAKVTDESVRRGITSLKLFSDLAIQIEGIGIDYNQTRVVLEDLQQKMDRLLKLVFAREGPR